jgi:hypothetical protein
MATSSLKKKHNKTRCDCDVETSTPVRKRTTRTVHHGNNRTSNDIREECMVSEEKCNSTLLQDSKSSVLSFEVMDTSDHSKSEMYTLLDGDSDTFLCEHRTEFPYQLTTEIQKTLYGSESEFSIPLTEEILKTVDDRIPEPVTCSPKELNEVDTAKLQVLRFSYSELLENAYLIPLPSSLWAVHKQPRDKYVAFVHMTFSTATGFKADRGVVFEGTCKPIIFFYGHKVPLPQLEKKVTCVDDVSNLLQELDEFHAVCLLVESTK